ncbi:MAG: PAS domain S-box-containing protein [Desulforhopalus sp.]|jgi:PAS domain S-box-containing protein
MKENNTNKIKESHESLFQLKQRVVELEEKVRVLQSNNKEKEYLLLLDTIETHIFYLIEPGSYGLVNRAHADFFGLHKEDLEYKNLYEILSVDEAKVCIADNARIFHNKKQIVTEEFMIRSDGEQRLFSFTKSPIFNDEGDVLYVVCTGEDITEKRKAKEELEANRYFLENVLDSIQDGISVLDQNYTIVFTNKIMREWYKDSGKLVGQKCYEAYHDSEKLCEICPTREALRSGETERRIIRGYPESEVNWIELFSFPLKDSENGEVTGVVEFVRDISDRIRLEKQLTQAQKMEAVGTLAGGVAHDFNNMLGGIIGATELLGLNIPLEPKVQKYQKMILESAHRAADLTDKLLAFARNNPQASVPVNIHGIIEETATLLKNTLDKRIELKISLEAERSIIIGDSSGLQNIILNICINSSHSMPDGGTISIDSMTTELDASYCNASTFDIQPGEYIELQILDTGIGISPNIIDKIFDPFFTTKERGKGTGLGLATAYGIVQMYHGAISVYSELGTGTCFYILLPLAPAGEKVTKVVTVLKKGHGTILVVDDEEVVRVTAKQILENLGYRIILCANGQEATTIFSKQSENIDLVLLDMIMPVMNGRDCFEQLKKIDPHVRVVLSSGFTKEEDLQKMKLLGLKGFIRKPYSSNELSLVVHEVLG